jgi:adenine-specific DNA methylase
MNKPQLQLPINEPEPRREAWRPIHYLGSKLRLVETLRLALDQVDPAKGRCIDLFAGSGTLSAALGSSRDITAVDIQEYSRVLCAAVLRPVPLSDAEVGEFKRSVEKLRAASLRLAEPLIEHEEYCIAAARSGDPEPICELIENASMISFLAAQPPTGKRLTNAHRRSNERLKSASAPSRVLSYYGGLYFSYRQAVELDALLTVAHNRRGACRDFFLAAIISTASDVVNTVGKHFAQPIRPRSADGSPKKHLIAKIIRDREIDLTARFNEWLTRYRSLPANGRRHEAIRADYSDALARMRSVGVVYADPPYTRDHYSRFYHVLETMCRWDDPGVSTTRIRSRGETYSRGMYRADRHQSPFCIRSQAPAAFEKLFAGVQALRAPLVLSYSPFASGDAHPRVVGIDQVTALARRYFKKVEVTSAGRFSHMKLNATRLHLEASEEAELIFLCS